MSDIYSSDNKNNGKNKKRSGNGEHSQKNRKYDDYVFVENREFEDVYSSSADVPMRTQSRRQQSATIKKPKKKKRILLKLATLLLLVIIAAGGISLYLAFSLLDDITYENGEKHVNSHIQSSNLASSANVKNILLIGVDSRKEETNTRSDTMMLVSINTSTKEIVLTSFMRDLYVKIPNNGHNRLNSANVFGGPELLMDTLELHFRIDIDNYVLVTFDVFEKLVDGVGGVYVDISEDEARYMRGSFVNLPHMESGKDVHLNGKEALWYARIRKLDSDFQRTERQREVVKSIISQATKTSPVKIYDTSKEAIQLIRTDLTKGDIISYATFAPALFTGYEIKSITVPADDTWYYASRYGMSVIIADEEENAEILKSEIYG